MNVSHATPSTANTILPIISISLVVSKFDNLAQRHKIQSMIIRCYFSTGLADRNVRLRHKHMLTERSPHYFIEDAGV